MRSDTVKGNFNKIKNQNQTNQQKLQQVMSFFLLR